MGRGRTLLRDRRQNRGDGGRNESGEKSRTLARSRGVTRRIRRGSSIDLLAYRLYHHRRVLSSRSVPVGAMPVQPTNELIFGRPPLVPRDALIHEATIAAIRIRRRRRRQMTRERGVTRNLIPYIHVSRYLHRLVTDRINRFPGNDNLRVSSSLFYRYDTGTSCVTENRTI